LNILTIKKSAEFQSINKKGQKFFASTLILLTHPTPETYSSGNSENICRIGYTVAKTVSKRAVDRNLAKRRLREAIKKIAPEFARSNFDYVVIARKEILEAEFKKIFGDLKFCITRIHQAKKSTSNEKKFPPKR
jgi:ribonuclease P protein component